MTILIKKIDSIDLLINKFGFTKEHISKLEQFHDILIKYNSKYNLISKTTENSIWNRHFLDSAQIIKFIDVKNTKTIADLGSGAGFPGLMLALLSEKFKFHVKLYEKSPVKRDFLANLRDKLDIPFDINDNVYSKSINSDLLVCRAFKKLEEIIRISREIVKKPHRIIILKGKNAQLEINKLSLDKNYSYKLKNSVTDKDSKIIIAEVKCNG